MTEVCVSKAKNCIGYDVTDEKKPFYLLNNVFVVIETYKDIIRFAIPKGYKWDGCTIKGKFLQLFFGCSHTPEYVIPSLLHDYILDHKDIVEYDRELSSEILEVSLINWGVGKLKAKIMRIAVDLWQKYIRGDEWVG